MFTPFHVGDLADPAVQPAVIQPVDSPLDVLLNVVGGIFDDYPVRYVLVETLQVEGGCLGLRGYAGVTGIDIADGAVPLDIKPVNRQIE